MMLQITPQMKILVAVAPVDFRNGIDGLARVCKNVLASDPFAGTVYVFRNRRGTAIKALVYDGQGFWLCQKRLSEDKFRWWPRATDPAADEHVKQLAAHELQILFSAGNPERTSAAPDWRPVKPT
jgi:transposase